MVDAFDPSSHDAPVTYVPDFISDSGSLFTLLWDELAWVKHDDRPRREYWQNDYNRPYTYGSGIGARTYEPQPHNVLITQVRDMLAAETGVYYEGCFLNGYDGARQHLGWHADDDPNIDHTKPIAVISIGEAREIWFRPKVGRDERVPGDVRKQMLEPGSLLLMHPGMQDTHEHRIPKSARACLPRISLTFRGLVS